MFNNIMHEYQNRDTYDLLILYHIGALENSIHFILDKQSKKCALIDPAWNAELFLSIINKLGYNLEAIWLTHWHPDHTNAVDEIVNITGVKVIAGNKEQPYFDLESYIEYYDDGDIVNIGNTKAQIINTPGHTKGGICYLLSDDFIAGDTLFVYGAGHTKLPGASIDDFYNSMQKIKKTIPDEVYLRCGHNYGVKITTTMAEQKKYNAYLLLDDKNDLTSFIKKMELGQIDYPIDRVNKEELIKYL